MQRALIHWGDSLCAHFDAASVYKSNAACVRQSTWDKDNWIRLLDAQWSDLKQSKTKSTLHTHTQTQTQTHTHRHTGAPKHQQHWGYFGNAIMMLASPRIRHEDFIKKTLCYWSPCLALYLFFTFDLPFRLSSRPRERKPLWCSFRSRIAAIPSGELKQLPESVTRLGPDLVSWLGKRLWVSPQC